MGVGKYRNSPCPCGSGKKFKNCHMLLKAGFVKTEHGIKKIHHIHKKGQTEKNCPHCKLLKKKLEVKVKGIKNGIRK